jgi:hypothetical protein
MPKTLNPSNRLIATRSVWLLNQGLLDADGQVTAEGVAYSRELIALFKMQALGEEHMTDLLLIWIAMNPDAEEGELVDNFQEFIDPAPLSCSCSMN